MSSFRTTTLRLAGTLPCLKHTTRYASAASLSHPPPPPPPPPSASPSGETQASATKAYTFKQTQRRKFPIPVIPTPPPLTAEEAVTNIIYNTPHVNSSTAEDKNKRSMLNCLVQDEPGVLSRVAGILAARGFNIDSLVVSKTEIKDLSRMTVVLKGADTNVEQARRQLEDLVPVWAVLDYTSVKLVERELLLVKVSTLGPEQEEMDSSDVNQSAKSSMLHSSSSLSSPFLDHHQMLTQTHERLRALTELSRLFNASVVDVCETSVIIELSAKSERIDAFIRLVNPFGIIEASRSGTMAIPRSVAAYPETDEETENKNVGSAVDATMLPPG